MINPRASKFLLPGGPLIGNPRTGFEYSSISRGYSQEIVHRNRTLQHNLLPCHGFLLGRFSSNIHARKSNSPLIQLANGNTRNKNHLLFIQALMDSPIIGEGFDDDAGLKQVFITHSVNQLKISFNRPLDSLKLQVQLSVGPLLCVDFRAS